jgi:hypothetical protein
MSLTIGLLIAAIVAAAAVYALRLRSRQTAATDDESATQRKLEVLDTVAAWPPEVTRLLTGGERTAHETLVKALPECLIFSQVPLARFVKVPRRYSYAEWLTRVGHMSTDFLICDRASLVIGAVSLQGAQESERAARRRARMTRVLKAAGVKVFVWREVAIPTPEKAREQIVQRTGVPATTLAPDADTAPPSQQPAATRAAKIPVPDVLIEEPDPTRRHEPPSSTWFDDLDSGPTPLDAESRQRGR